MSAGKQVSRTSTTIGQGALTFHIDLELAAMAWLAERMQALLAVAQMAVLRAGVLAAGRPGPVAEAIARRACTAMAAELAVVTTTRKLLPARLGAGKRVLDAANDWGA